jgi:calcium-dependent protein kinase
VHRDLKPENLLLETKPAKKTNSLSIKVIDFGTSALFDPKKKLSVKYGTPYYIAPEVLEGDYNELCDIWSIGVIMYIMLAGYPPFNGESNDTILQAVSNMKFSFPEAEWGQISPEAKAMIRRMLIP